MDPVLVNANNTSYAEFSTGSISITSERDALDLVSYCGQYEVHAALLDGRCLDDAFFDLRTGLAGAALLKWSIYQLRVAVILPPERIGTGRFSEFVLETNRGNQFRVFQDHSTAVEWLTRR